MQACRKQGAGGQLSPRFWKVKRRRRATAACRITTCPPRFLDFATCLKCTIGISVLGWRYLLPMYIKYISFYEFSWMMRDLIFVISSSVFDFYKIRYAVSAIFGPTYLSLKRKEFGPNVDIQQNLLFGCIVIIKILA